MLEPLTTSNAADHRVEGARALPAALPVAAAAAALLEQCAEFVRAAGGEAYAGPSRVLPGGTIGKHIRHTLDHFRAALEGPLAGVIDYDHRERDTPMETDPAEALAAIEALRGRILELGAADLERPVRIRIMVSGDGREAELGSTLGRELAFAAHHAVHHQAMLGAIAAEYGIARGEELGRAPSTVHHEKGRNG
jgi:hypothetical protein